MAFSRNESVALESPGPGGSLQWKEHLSGHWSAKGLGGRYDIYPRGAGGYTAYWEQSGTGSQHELGSYDTIGAAFGACRRHADGERRQTAAAEEDHDAVAKDVARKAVASAYGADQVDHLSKSHPTTPGEPSFWNAWLKNGKRLTVHVNGSTGTVTDPDDGHVVATHTVSEGDPSAMGESCGCPHSHPKSVPTTPCAGEAVENLVMEAANLSSAASKKRFEQLKKAGCHPKRVRVNGQSVVIRDKNCSVSSLAHETVPVIHEANDAGAFATMDRDTKELAKGKALGKACTPTEIFKLVRDPLEKESQEVFLVIPLDLHGELISRPIEVARGQRDRVSIGISDVMRPVAQTNAKGFVVVHNHPSGHARPSPKDRELTETIRKYTFPDVVFLDHIVVGSKQFFSFTENRLYKVR